LLLVGGVVYLFAFGLESDSAFVLIHCAAATALILTGFIIEVCLWASQRRTMRSGTRTSEGNDGPGHRSHGPTG